MAKSMNFTKQALNSIPVPKSRREYYRDTKERGLALYITPKGVITFFVRKRVNGKDDRIVLGRFPEMSVENARKLALKAKSDVAQGIDPAQEKRQLKAEITFGELFSEYMERYSKRHKRSWKYDEREVNKFLSHWFNRKISSITTTEIQKLHIRIGEGSGKYQANRLLERIRAIFNRAIEWGWKGTNPALGIRKFREKARDRFLQPDELPVFFQSLEHEPNEIARDYIYLSLYTGARKANVLSMRWQDINLERAEWRIEDTKNGESLTVHLPKPALDIIIRRKSVTTSPYVFPGEGLSGHLQDPKKPWKRILARAAVYQLISLVAQRSNWSNDKVKAARVKAESSLQKAFAEYQLLAEKLKIDTNNVGLPDLRIHDLRRSLGSWQAASGASSYIIGKSLGHKSQQATAIYARLNLDPVRASVDAAVDAMILNARNR